MGHNAISNHEFIFLFAFQGLSGKETLQSYFRRNVSLFLGVAWVRGLENRGRNQDQACVSRKSRGLFGPEKPFVKLQPAYCVKLVFSYVVKGIKVQITARFRASRRLRFEDTKIIMSPEIRPKSFATFEKQAPGFKGKKRSWNRITLVMTASGRRFMQWLWGFWGINPKSHVLSIGQITHSLNIRGFKVNTS